MREAQHGSPADVSHQDCREPPLLGLVVARAPESPTNASGLDANAPPATAPKAKDQATEQCQPLSGDQCHPQPHLHHVHGLTSGPMVGITPSPMAVDAKHAPSHTNQQPSGAAVGSVPFVQRGASDANEQLRRGLAEHERVWGEVASRELRAAEESALLAHANLEHLDAEMALLDEELRKTRDALGDAAVRDERHSVMSVGEPRRALGEDGEVRAVVALVEGRRWVDAVRRVLGVYGSGGVSLDGAGRASLVRRVLSHDVVRGGMASFADGCAGCVGLSDFVRLMEHVVEGVMASPSSLVSTSVEDVLVHVECLRAFVMAFERRVLCPSTSLDTAALVVERVALGALADRLGAADVSLRAMGVARPHRQSMMTAKMMFSGGAENGVEIKRRRIRFDWIVDAMHEGSSMGDGGLRKVCGIVEKV